LRRPWNDDEILMPKRPLKLPIVLSPEQVVHLLNCVASTKHRADALAGYGVALLSALTWASYSVISRVFAGVPSSAVTLYCAATAVAGAAAHFALEETVWPLSGLQWIAAAGLGLGPVGLAFYVWDYGCKHGDLRVLGASAYFAPLLSTVLLVVFGLADGSPALWLAALAITGGAMLASKDMLGRKSPAASMPVKEEANA
jgi:drug/metabolite transporter (DMT)-like permease